MTWHLSRSRRLAFLAALVLLACSPLGCGKEEKSAEEEEHAAPVKWEAAEPADLEEWTELLGTTQPLPNHVAQISAVSGGYVVSVLPGHNGKEVVEGQRVEAGQVLVKLDDRVLRASRGKLVAGEAELKEQITQAATALDLARLELERLVRLQNPTGSANSSTVPLVTRLEMDRARLALKDAESKHKAAQAKEEVSHAEVKMIDEELHLYTLRSPIDGQLGMLHARPGQSLSAGTTVAEVVNLDQIDVLCFVPPRIVAHLHLDQLVRIPDEGEPITDAVKAEQGRIVFIADQAQAETGTVAIKARFPNRHRKLRANTLLRVRVLTEKKEGCLALPESALLEDQEEPAVLVIETEKKEKDGKEEEEHHVHKFQAELGLRDRDKHKVEIVGLIGKDKKKVPVTKETLFVVEGGHGLEDDDLVTEKKEEHEEHKDEKEHKEEKEPKEEK